MRTYDFIRRLSIEEFILNLTFKMNSYTQIRDVFKNIFFVSPIIVIVSIFIGTLFYFIVNPWNLATSVYYAIQVLLGCMYGTPVETSWESKYFTLFYYIWGSILLAGAIGAYASTIVENIIQIERKKSKIITPDDIDGDGVIGIIDITNFNMNLLVASFLEYIGWTSKQNRSPYIIKQCKIFALP
jgi:hypothetical protein